MCSEDSRSNTVGVSRKRSFSQGLDHCDQEFRPLSNICEFLNALHIYSDEARNGETRALEANHFCSHVRKGRISGLKAVDA